MQALSFIAHFKGKAMSNIVDVYAYAVGYYDGRAEGVEKCPFDDDCMRDSYKRGYETGVTDYCYFLEQEETNDEQE